MSSDAIIVAMFSGIGLLITAVVTAWITLRKSRVELDKARAETDKTKRNGILEEWRVITDRLQATVKEQDVEIKSLRGEVIKMHEEIAELRVQIVARETERVVQRGEIRTLEKHVGELKKPDTQALAEAIVPKLAEAMGNAPPTASAAPTPVTIVPASDPLPVAVTKQKPKKP